MGARTRFCKCREWENVSHFLLVSFPLIVLGDMALPSLAISPHCIPFYGWFSLSLPREGQLPMRPVGSGNPCLSYIRYFNCSVLIGPSFVILHGLYFLVLMSMSIFKSCTFLVHCFQCFLTLPSSPGSSTGWRVSCRR